MSNLIERYEALYKGLKPVTGMWVSPQVRMGAALSVLTMDTEVETLIDTIKTTAAQSKQHHAKLGALKDQWRFMIASSFMLGEADPLTLESALTNAQNIWKQNKLHGHDPYKSFSLMALVAAGAQVDSPTLIGQIADTYKRIKKSYFFTGSPSLLPYLALMAATMPEKLTDLPERFHHMGPMRDAGEDTHISAIFSLIADKSGQDIGHYIVETRKKMRKQKMRGAADLVSLLALAAISDIPTDTLLATTATNIAALKEHKLGGSERQMIALYIAINDNASMAASQAPTIALISTISAILAQQAAMIAAITATTVATAAAT